MKRRDENLQQPSKSLGFKLSREDSAWKADPVGVMSNVIWGKESILEAGRLKVDAGVLEHEWRQQGICRG